MDRLIVLNTELSESSLQSLQDSLGSSFVISSAVAGTRLSQIAEDLSTTNSVILVEASLLDFKEELVNAIDDASSQGAVLFDFQFDSEEASFIDTLPESVIDSITQIGMVPSLMIKLPADFIQTLEDEVLADGRETILRCAISAIASSTGLDRSLSPVVLANTNGMSCNLPNDMRARLISYAVGSINIEDLFPRHAWTQHEEESAAACFHTLAAHFIRYGDLKAAEECLSFSERLEDSPRALALRGLISKQNGETLGAVANLVSSLQGYESRKRSAESEHYIVFTPTDLEGINSSLHNGLSALNQQDNDTAFSHFARAVFNFDSFFSSIGLQSQEQ